jgi:hypothetical protein
MEACSVACLPKCGGVCWVGGWPVRGEGGGVGWWGRGLIPSRDIPVQDNRTHKTRTHTPTYTTSCLERESVPRLPVSEPVLDYIHTEQLGHCLLLVVGI